MNIIKPLVVGFSLLAFSGAYAQTGQQEKAQERSAQTQPMQPGQQSQQATPSQDQAASGGASAQSQSQLGANELVGKKVMDKDGKELGEIEDVVIDLQSGKVHAAVLSFGGILGMGEKNYAFPIDQLKPGQQQGQYTMDVDKQKLENADGFAKGQWPEMDDEYWGRTGGQQQASAGSGGQQKMNLVRASEMKGKEVSDKSGQQVGEIKDVTLDLQSGQLRNVMIDVEGGGQAEVQPNELTAGTDDKFVIATDAEQLKQQAKSQREQQSSQSGQQGQQGQGASAGGGSAGGSAGGTAGAGQPGAESGAAGQQPSPMNRK